MMETTSKQGDIFNVHERKKSQIPRISVSDVAALAGYHIWTNIIEKFQKYLYQDLEELYFLDLQNLSIEIVQVNLDTLSPLLTKENIELLKVIDKNVQSSGTYQNSTEVEKSVNVIQKVFQSIDINKSSVLKTLDQTVLVQIKVLEADYTSKVRMRHGVTCELSALDKYHEVTGYPIDDRNTIQLTWAIPVNHGKLESRILQLLRRKPNISTSSTNNRLCDADGSNYNGINNSSTGVDINSFKDIDVTEIISPYLFDIYPSTENLYKQKLMKLLNNKQVSNVEDDGDKSDNTQTIFTIDDDNTNNSNNNNDERGTDIDNDVIISNTNGNCTVSVSGIQSVNTNHNDDVSNTIKIDDDELIAFYIVGRPDGMSYQLNMSHENYTQWKLEPVVIEAKTRTTKLSIPPPLYDQVQLVTYMLMSKCRRGDLFQTIRTSSNHGSCNNRRNRNNDTDVNNKFNQNNSMSNTKVRKRRKKANSGYHGAVNNSSSIDVINDNGILFESIADRIPTNATTISPLKRNRVDGINEIKLNNDSVLDSNSFIITESSVSVNNESLLLSSTNNSVVNNNKEVIDVDEGANSLHSDSPFEIYNTFADTAASSTIVLDEHTKAVPPIFITIIDDDDESDSDDEDERESVGKSNINASYANTNIANNHTNSTTNNVNHNKTNNNNNNNNNITHTNTNTNNHGNNNNTSSSNNNSDSNNNSNNQSSNDNNSSSNNHTNNTNVYKKDNFHVHRIDLDTDIHHHDHHFFSDVLPRLRVFVRAVQRVRLEDELRYQWLLAETDEEKRKILIELCPYFDS